MFQMENPNGGGTQKCCARLHNNLILSLFFLDGLLLPVFAVVKKIPASISVTRAIAEANKTEIPSVILKDDDRHTVIMECISSSVGTALDG